MKIYDTEEGVFNACKGDYNGGVYLFTHRDPKSGMLWGEDIPVKNGQMTTLGAWVAPDSVTLRDEVPIWDELVM